MKERKKGSQPLLILSRKSFFSLEFHFLPLFSLVPLASNNFFLGFFLVTFTCCRRSYSHEPQIVIIHSVLWTENRTIFSPSIQTRNAYKSVKWPTMCVRMSSVCLTNHWFMKCNESQRESERVRKKECTSKRKWTNHKCVYSNQNPVKNKHTNQITWIFTRQQETKKKHSNSVRYILDRHRLDCTARLDLAVVVVVVVP